MVVLNFVTSSAEVRSNAIISASFLHIISNSIVHSQLPVHCLQTTAYKKKKKHANRPKIFLAQMSCKNISLHAYTYARFKYIHTYIHKCIEMRNARGNNLICRIENVNVFISNLSRTTTLPCWQ